MLHMDRVQFKTLFRDRTEATLDRKGPGPGLGPVLTLHAVTAIGLIQSINQSKKGARPTSSQAN